MGLHIAEYEQLKRSTIQGWQTVHVQSVLCHVWMPSGLSLSLGIKEYKNGGYLREALIGRQTQGAEEVFPIAHGQRYTCLRVLWRDIQLFVETACLGENFVMRVVPEKTQLYPPMLVLETGFLWKKTGILDFDGNKITAQTPKHTLSIRCAGKFAAEDLNLPVQTPYLTRSAAETTLFYTGDGTENDALSLLDRTRAEYEKLLERHGKNAPFYEAIECALRWDTIYDATHDRVISPVSRIWSIGQGGYVLFCWDTYFAAALALPVDASLALSNLIEITNEATPGGFIPNFSNATGMASLDRSQPPVGSAMTLMVACNLKCKWVVRALYPSLFAWNTWFFTHRRHKSGAMGWGSNAYTPVRDNYWEHEGVHERFGAALESGLDNSPMYDNVPFDKESSLLCLEDVGLTGLYIFDCRSLIELCRIAGQEQDIPELEKRLKIVENGLEGLWSEKYCFYMNKRTDTGEFSQRISPTNFYALFSLLVPNERLSRIEAHYFNENEFYGDYVLPSISRNDPAFPDQDYWRGRIWAPMNFLTYLAAKQHSMNDMCHDLARKSSDLFLKEWLEHRHIHENYSGINGEGCDKPNSDRFYHWGALLPLIMLIEDGELCGPLDSEKE